MKATTLGLLTSLTLLAATGAASAADLPPSTGWVDQAASAASTFLATNMPDIMTPATPASDRFADLLRIDEAATTVAPAVSRAVQNVQTIRKIGYGNVTTVSIVTTPSGVYSSDGLASPHVLYPGIEAKPDARKGFATLFALIGGAWTPFSAERAGSFVFFGSGNGTSYRTDGRTTCFSGAHYHGCS